jgi:hypothetical protein
MDDIYSEREQTHTKHFLLKSYLQTLVYKLFHGGQRSITYVDGFSGPWKSKTPLLNLLRQSALIERAALSGRRRHKAAHATTIGNNEGAGDSAQEPSCRTDR